MLGICLRKNNSQEDSMCFRYVSTCVILNFVRLSVGSITIGLETTKEAIEGRISWFMRHVLGLCQYKSCFP